METTGYVYGYNRVSTKEQHLDRGRKSIETFCQDRGYKLERIFEDKQTGRHFDRPRYTVLKEDVLRPGDMLIVPEYDRLGRADQTKGELQYFKERGIRVVFLDIPTTTINLSGMTDEMAKMLMEFMNDMLISFYDLMARTELERKRKRQREGMDAMRDRGEWGRYGRPRRMSREEFAGHYKRVERGEIGTIALMRELGFNKDTYFRYVREYRNGKKENCP